MSSCQFLFIVVAIAEKFVCIFAEKLKKIHGTFFRIRGSKNGFGSI